MRKSIDYVLNYREKGKSGSISLKIDFVSNYVRSECDKIIQAVYEAQTAWDKIIYKISEKKALEVEKPEGFDSKINIIDNEILSLSNSIKTADNESILKRRFELVKIILEDNGIEEPRLLDFDFWDRCVEPNDINDFLTACVWKDFDKKKAH